MSQGCFPLTLLLPALHGAAGEPCRQVCGGVPDGRTPAALPPGFLEASGSVRAVRGVAEAGLGGYATDDDASGGMGAAGGKADPGGRLPARGR